MSLDFSAVTFIDDRGAEMLKGIAAENLQIGNCSPFIIKALVQPTEDS